MEYTPPLRRVEGDSDDLAALNPAPGVDYQRIDPVVRYLWFIGRAIFWCIVFVIAIVVAIALLGSGTLPRTTVVAVLCVLLFLAFLHLLWPFLSYRHWGYALRRTDFLIRSGVLFKRVSVVPFARIQHVDNDAGPLERSFGVANLVIHTAGAHMGSLSVPGLPAERAEQLRDFLSEVGHTHANI